MIRFITAFLNWWHDRIHWCSECDAMWTGRRATHEPWCSKSLRFRP